MKGWKETKIISRTLLGVVLVAGAGCSSKIFDNLNPYDVTPESELGERTNKAILEGGEQASQSEQARHALEVMSSYQRALPPQPGAPVRTMPDIRLMWVPDHLTKTGDMVPAHYYYLKVTDGMWATQDAFDIMDQLDKSSASGAGSAVPYIYRQQGK